MSMTNMSLLPRCSAKPVSSLPTTIGTFQPTGFRLGSMFSHPRSSHTTRCLRTLRLGFRAVEAVAARSGNRGRRLTVQDVFQLLEDRYGWFEAVQFLRQAAALDDLR